MMTMYENRLFKVVNYETKQGKQLSERCENYEGERLGQVYNSWSDRKQAIYDEWYSVYCRDSKADSFSIVSHNCQHFSLGWFSTLQTPLCKGLSREVSILVTPFCNYMIVYPE